MHLKTVSYGNFNMFFHTRNQAAARCVDAFPRHLRSLTDRRAPCLFATNGYAMAILLARGGGFVRYSIGVVPDERVL